MVVWLKKYFHALVKKNKRRNHITHLLTDDGCTESEGDVAEKLVDYYKTLLGANSPGNGVVDDILESGTHISQADGENLIVPITGLLGDINVVLERVGFSEGELPVKYLSVPLAASTVQVKHYDVLIDKLADNIKKWSLTYLSYAGMFWKQFVGINYFSVSGTVSCGRGLQANVGDSLLSFQAKDDAGLFWDLEADFFWRVTVHSFKTGVSGNLTSDTKTWCWERSPAVSQPRRGEKGPSTKSGRHSTCGAKARCA
ncbi:hypothetical protein ACS0TY_034170 [Phlomoides rotata]